LTRTIGPVIGTQPWLCASDLFLFSYARVRLHLAGSLISCAPELPFFLPHAPQLAHAEMDYLVEDVVIGCLAPVSAEYRVTGVRTFVLSQNGVVDEKDFGSQAVDEFKMMAAVQRLQALDSGL